MAKKALTPEEKAALTLRLQTAEDLSTEEVKQLQEAFVASSANEIVLQDDKTALETKLEALESENSALTNEVPGTYKAANKKEYRFTKGHTATRYKGEVVDSAKLLKDSEAMEYLIKLGYGGIEVVEK